MCRNANGKLFKEYVIFWSLMIFTEWKHMKCVSHFSQRELFFCFVFIHYSVVFAIVRHFHTKNHSGCWILCTFSCVLCVQPFHMSKQKNFSHLLFNGKGTNCQQLSARNSTESGNLIIKCIPGWSISKTWHTRLPFLIDIRNTQDRCIFMSSRNLFAKSYLWNAIYLME